MVQKANGVEIRKLVPKPDPEWIRMSKEVVACARQIGLNTIAIQASFTLSATDCRKELDVLQAELRGYLVGVREGARIRGVVQAKHNAIVNRFQAQAGVLRGLSSRAVAACIEAKGAPVIVLDASANTSKPRSRSR